MRQAFVAAMASVALVVSVGLYARPAQAGVNSASQSRLLVAQNTPSNLFSLLQDIQRLREQVRRMRGEIQSLRHQIKRNRRIRQRMFQKLDKRLTALEKGGVAKAGAKAGKAEIKQSYLAAFDLLRNGKYNQAIDSLKQFVDTYPDNSYSDNALYWLGQARYVQGDLSGAMKALKKLTNRFPKSNKMSSALLRMGMIMQTEGKTDKARAIFNRILKKYPDSENAAAARKQLRKM